MLPCPTQTIRLRDGKDAWMSELIGEYSGRGVDYTGPVLSSGNVVLIDFHLNDSQIVSSACYAGFIGHVEVIGEFSRRVTFIHSLTHTYTDPPNVTITAESSIMGMITKDTSIVQLNLTHFFVFAFIGVIIIISVFLAAQYVFRYHRYQLAKSKEEQDSPLNTPHGSTVSITRLPGGGGSDLRAVSTSTLLSEVVTLVKLKPKSSSAAATKTSIKHQKLRESVISQDDDKDQLNDCDSIGTFSK